MTKITRFLIWAGGYDVQTAKLCTSSEINKLAIVGSTLFIAPLVGLFSYSYAFYFIFNNYFAAVFGGIFFSLVIFIIDRSIIAVGLFNKYSLGYRRKFYGKILDTWLETLNERCDAALKMQESEHRQKVANFVILKMEQSIKEIKECKIVFLEMMKKKYIYAKTLKNIPSIQSRYTENLFSEEKRYLKFLDSNLSKFESIIDEQRKK